MVSISDLAKKSRVHRTTISRRFSNVKTQPKILPLNSLPSELILVLDATQIASKKLLSLVYEYTSSQPLAWSFPERESYFSWQELLTVIKLHFRVMAVVSDGQKGLRKAIKEVFPEAIHQRCIAHVIRLSLAWLTKNPQTEAGKLLRDLVLILSEVKTEAEGKIWSKSFILWNEKYDFFLKEKSHNPLTGRSWPTHKKLRAVRSLIKNALPDLFWFLKNEKIPSTTNIVEGGINALISESLRRHRGIKIEQKEQLICEFLRDRRKRKLSTRNAT